jgi:hypothetical protein
VFRVGFRVFRVFRVGFRLLQTPRFQAWNFCGIASNNQAFRCCHFCFKLLGTRNVLYPLNFAIFCTFCKASKRAPLKKFIIK